MEASLKICLFLLFVVEVVGRLYFFQLKIGVTVTVCATATEGLKSVNLDPI